MMNGVIIVFLIPCAITDLKSKTKARSDIIFYDNWSDIIGGC